jgi:alkylated DNA repair dioxygenase AlkB
MQVLSIPGAELYYDEHFLAASEATTLFEALLAKCSWERRRSLFKRPVPRDEAYYGDPGTHYTYSQRQYQPLRWIPELVSLKLSVEEATPLSAYANVSLARVGYNAVLCNLYRDGNDSVALHSDAEREMGPVIASVSLGVERLFRIKRHDGSVAFAERLPHGSLLIMAGTTQLNCKHEAPKEPGITRPRINLTFRHIEHK